jgi:hypothetical protein
LSEALDGDIDSVVEIDERARRPKPLPELAPRDHLPGLLQHQGERLERLAAQF